VDAVGRQVAPGGEDRGRVEVGRVHLDVRADGQQGGAEGAAAAAEIEGHRAGPGGLDREPEQELAAAARHEDPGLQGDPDPAELRPAQDLLQRAAALAVAQHPLEVVGRARCRDQQRRLILGEHAPGRAEPAHCLGHRAIVAGSAQLERVTVLPWPLPTSSRPPASARSSCATAR
jgi:hypothetical protein